MDLIKELFNKRNKHINLRRINIINYKPTYDLTESASALINLNGDAVKEAKEIGNKQSNVVKFIGPDQGVI